MKSRYQWRAVTSSCHISAPEVRYGGDFGDFSDHIRITYLQGECRLRVPRGSMANGLAMATNCADAFPVVAQALDERRYRGRGKLAQSLIATAEQVDVIALGLTEREQVLSKTVG